MANRKLQAHFYDMRAHVGHRVTYGFPEPKEAIVLRVTLDESLSAVMLWLEGKPFPTQIYSDGVRSCSCQTERREWNPSDDYH